MMMFVTSLKVLKRRLCNRLIYYFLSRKGCFLQLYFFGKKCVLKSSRPSLPLKKAPPLISVFSPQGREDVTALQCCICPTCPSPAGGSLTHSQALALSKRARDVTALRCSEPLRFMVVGPSKVYAMLCGLVPPGNSSL